MSEQPATIAHEAKGIHQSLKEILNANGPLDREVDFQRKRLRKQYLSLLLEYPYAKESKDAEMHLWMQTSYAFISAYKQRLLSLDKAMQNKANHAQQQGQDNNHNNNTNPAPNGRNNNNSHVVEHRKFLQRFKQFLADEEKFWKQLVVRFWRSFGLHEAKQALVALDLIAEEAGTQEDGGNDHQQGGHGRNHFQFPQESATVFVPRTAEERESWISMITKSLICLGDIARYRAFYSDPGRPKPGQDEGRRGRNRRGGHVAEAIPRPKNYEKAQAYYQQAALLSPNDGNAYHQLAILATYRKDPFMSVMYHYRALCVRSPYDPALDNMNGILSKSLDQWKHHAKQEGRDLPPGLQTEAFKERILALNGLWKIGLEKGVDKMDALTRRRNMEIFNDLAGLISRRFINQQGIQHTLIIAQGALWKHRMLRPPTNSSNRGDKPPPPPGTSVVIEWRILEHLMNVHRALLIVGSEELKTDIPADDLGQCITAPFRRTLHSLRIASKWLRANLAYLMQDHEFDSYQAHKANGGVEVHRNKDFRLSRFSEGTKQFWAAYCEFMSSLSVKFPADRLPAITVQFDEDTEMRGFLPLRNQIGEVRESTEDGANSHPNDWELMRIADLLKDGQELVTAPNSPIFESYGIYNIRQGIFEPRQPNSQAAETRGPAQPQRDVASAPRPTSRPEVQDDGNMTDSTSRTEDDILNEIYQVVHSPGGEEDEELDDDEEIVWDPRASLSPQMNSNLPSPPQLTPVVNTVPLRSPPTSVHQLSPTHSQTLSPFSKPIHPPGPAPTTAQDLLNDVLSGRTARAKMEPSAAAAPALFSDLNHASGGHNIWSAAQDEQSLKFSSQPNQTYQHRQPQSISTSMGLSPPTWSSSYPVSTQDSHRDLPGSLPPPIYGQLSPNLRAGNHQRIPSNGLGLGLGSQTLSPPRYGAGLPDTLVYSSTSPPRVPARPDLYGLGSTSPLMGQSMASINSIPNGLYSNSPLLNYNGNHPINTSHAFASPPMSNAHPHMWSNVG